jgi:opacity protein-like surface antigen
MGRVQSFFKDGEFKYLASLTLGYDNNVWLNSRRDGDGYMQLFFRPTFTSALNDKLDGILEYELMSLIYMTESNASLITNTLGAGVDYKINKDWKLSTMYRFSSTELVHTGKDDFLDNSLELKLAQKLPDKFFHSLGYELMYKNYRQRKLRTSAMLDSYKERADERHTAAYEIGKYFPSDLVKLKFQYYNNDSNDAYLKYYDYDSFKLGISLTHIFNKKYFCSASFSEQWRDFRSRTISLDSNTQEWDKTYLAALGIYYNLSKKMTIGLNYTYRQNCSNEPLENYSGSLTSVSTSYKF